MCVYHLFDLGLESGLHQRSGRDLFSSLSTLNDIPTDTTPKVSLSEASRRDPELLRHESHHNRELPYLILLMVKLPCVFV